LFINSATNVYANGNDVINTTTVITIQSQDGNLKKVPKASRQL